jgi:hypothetical protein
MINPIKNEKEALNLINSTNHNELISLLGKVTGELFWYKRKANFSKTSNLRAALLCKMLKLGKKRLNSKNVPLEINANGVRIDRESTHFSAQVYQELLFQNSNWRIFLSLDSFHIYWINTEEFKIVCYVEGDIIKYTALNKEMLKAETKNILDWYKFNE